MSDDLESEGRIDGLPIAVTIRGPDAEDRARAERLMARVESELAAVKWDVERDDGE